MTDQASHSGTDYITFEENRRAADLAGPHDTHLAILEEMTGARIDPIGNKFAISGAPGARLHAVNALETLYDALVNGRPLGVGEVRAAAKLATAMNRPSGAPSPNTTPSDNGPAKDTPSIGGVARSARQRRDIEPAQPDRTIKTPKRLIAARTPAQRQYLNELEQNELVFGVGPAGTGKTYLAVAHAVSLLMSGAVERLILSRPAVEAGERIGFLPGDMKDKVDPYLRPLYDALNDMLHTDYVERRIDNGEIEIAPLAFMRGRTLTRAAVILDEAQNATAAQTKMFLTRLGDGSRMVLTGDTSQSDLPRGETSGLSDALQLLDGVDGVGVSHFTTADVVRHPLVGRILDRYDARDQANRAPSGRTPPHGA